MSSQGSAERGADSPSNNQSDSGSNAAVHPHALFIASILLTAYDEYLRVRGPQTLDGAREVGYNENKCSGERTSSDSPTDPEEHRE